MVKIDTLFLTKTGLKNPRPLGPHSPYKGIIFPRETMKRKKIFDKWPIWPTVQWSDLILKFQKNKQSFLLKAGRHP